MNFAQFKDECVYQDSQDLLFSNAITTEVTDVCMEYEPATNPNEKDKICAQFGYNTTCGEVLNLRNFPFDRQILQLEIANQNTFENKKIRFQHRKNARWVTLLGALTTDWHLANPKLGCTKYLIFFVRFFCLSL